MATFKIELTDSEARRIQQIAKEHGLTPEDLLRRGVVNWLSASSRNFTDAATYVINKNANLYDRLS